MRTLTLALPRVSSPKDLFPRNIFPLVGTFSQLTLTSLGKPPSCHWDRHHSSKVLTSGQRQGGRAYDGEVCVSKEEYGPDKTWVLGVLVGRQIVLDT